MHDAAEPKRIFSGLDGIYDSLIDWVYPLLRATAGFMLLPHAWPGVRRARGGGKCAGAPWNRAGATNRISHHVSRIGRGHLYYNRLSHAPVCAIAFDRIAGHYI